MTATPRPLQALREIRAGKVSAPPGRGARWLGRAGWLGAEHGAGSCPAVGCRWGGAPIRLDFTDRLRPGPRRVWPSLPRGGGGAAVQVTRCRWFANRRPAGDR